MIVKPARGVRRRLLQMLTVTNAHADYKLIGQDAPTSQRPRAGRS